MQRSLTPRQVAATVAMAATVQAFTAFSLSVASRSPPKRRARAEKAHVANSEAHPATVLLVHGLWMGGWSMSWLAHKLREAGFMTEALSYDSFTVPPEEHVARLAQAVGSCGGTVHLIGHSMGGLVVLRYLLGSPRPATVGRAVLLGTPLRGSQAALAFERQPWGRTLLGSSIDLWRSAFPEGIDGDLEIGAIAGSEPFGLGPLFVSLPPPSDGVVTVDETKIPGLHDHIVLPVSHTGMLVSNAVAHHVTAFLRTGSFER